MKARGFKVLLLAGLAVLSGSCAMNHVHEREEVYIRFSISTHLKSSSETGISTLDLLVFLPDGALGVYERVSGSEVASKVLAGTPLNWYLVANAPEGSLSMLEDERDFLAKLSRLGDSDGFVMRASGTRIFLHDDTVYAELVRLACKVTLESLAPLFLADSYEGCDVRVTRISLINVVGTCPYSMIPHAGEWYNMLGMDDELPTGVRKLIDMELDIPLTASGLEGPWSLYCMPNPVDNGVHSGLEPSWSPRNTRLVLELDIDGVKSWYPMDLPAMKCNHEYIFKEVRLLGEGSGHPDIPVARSGVSFEIGVDPWAAESKDVCF